MKKKDCDQRLAAAVHPLMEAMEARRLLAVSSLPLVFEFDGSQSTGLLDRDGQFIGFTRVQENRLGTGYQPSLIDLDPATGQLKITSTGSSSSGSNRDLDNTLVNAVEVEFNGSQGAFTITTRLVGPLNYIDIANEQGGIMFGPDQDNYVKFVALAKTGGTVLQFGDEQTSGGVVSHPVTQEKSIGDFAAVNTLDLRLICDSASGNVTAQYAVNGGAFQAMTGTVTLAGPKKAEFFNAASRASLITMHKNNVGPVTVAYDRFDIAVRPSAIGSNPTNGMTDVPRDAFVGVDLFLPNGALDPLTVTGATVKLVKTNTGAVIPAVVNTSGGGDSIVLQPSALLDPNTQYTFTITDGVKDLSGASITPYTISFTTGTTGGPPVTNIEFEKVLQPQTSGYDYTSVAVGPDGRLYGGTVDGRIIRYDILADGTLGEPFVINTLRTANGGIPRLLIGFDFEPGSTASNLRLWVTHGDIRFDDAPEWSCKVTLLRGPNLEIAEDAIVDLPRAAHNHLTNQPEFGPDGFLYVSQGGNTAHGDMDSTWGLRPERLLNAAILKIDIHKLTPGNPLSVKTEEGGTYNPWAPGAPVTLYATGLRNAYDMVWTQDGRLYAPNNGSNAGGNSPSTPGLPIPGSIRIDGDDDNNPANGMYNGPAVTGLTPVNETQNDYLFNVVQGGYYGHPNPKRYEYVLYGGNPTAGSDPQEIKQYPVGVQPDRNYRGAAFDFGAKRSPNGIIEYRSNTFGGSLQGKLLVVRFSGGDDIVILSRNPDGSIAGSLTGVTGMTGFADPLDLIEDTRTGFIYVAEFAGGRITMLRPTQPPSAPTGVNTTSGGPNQVLIGWNAVNGASRYTIQRKAPGESTFSDLTTVTTTSYLDSTVTAGATYQYKVRAENNAGLSNFTAAVTAVTPAPGTWGPGVNLPVSMAELAGAIIGNKLYVAGEGSPLTWIFDFGTQQWTSGATRPFTGDAFNSEHLTVTYNGKLYLIGGLSGGSENKVQIYDPATNSWSLGADRGWNAGSSSGALINGWVYVAGGAVSAPSYGPVGRTARYNPATNTWQELAPMPSARHASSFASDGSKLWIFGGRDAGLEASDGTNTVHVYDPATNTWASSADPLSGIPPMPRKSRGASAVYHNGEFYIFGGENSSGQGTTPDQVFNEVLIYNPVTKQWRQGPTMITARHALLTIERNNKIYAIAGGVVHGTSASKITEILDLAGNPVPKVPTDVSATTVSPTRIDVNWADKSNNETSFQILRSTDGNSFTPLTTVPPNVTVYSDTAVTNGVAYFYVVRAVNATGSSVNSNVGSAIAGQPTVPSNPTNLVATPFSSSKIDLSWGSSGGASRYLIERKGPSDVNFIQIGTSTTNSFRDTGLLFSTTYSYRVRAENTIGLSGYSSVSSATTPLLSPMVSTDINATPAGNTSVVNERKDYDITAGGSDIFGTSDSFRYVYEERVGDFEFKVRLESLSEVSSGTKAGLMVRESLGANSRHAYVAATASDGYRFGYRAATGGSTANVFKGGPDPAYPNVWLRIKRQGNVFTAAYSHDGTTWVSLGSLSLALPETVYFGMAVAAKSSTNATTAEFRDLTEIVPVPPTVPTGFSAAEVSATDAFIRWDAVDGATSYQLERKGPNDADFVQIGASSSGTNYLDQGLTTGVVYQYRVRAENGAGSSNYTEVKSVLPAAGTRGSLDIGNPKPGTTSQLFPGNGYDIAGAGTDIYRNADQFRFVSELITGDFDVRIRVDSIEAINAGVKAGLMARESLAADSRHVFISVTPADGLRFSRRDLTGGSTVNAYKGGTQTMPNQWLRLTRSGGVINGYISSNGSTWTLLSTTTLALPNTLYLGMAVASKVADQTSLVQFRELTFVTEQTPVAPTNFTAGASGNTSAILNWTASPGSSTYLIERKGPGDADFIQIATTGNTTYTNTGLSVGASYLYRVRAANSAGISDATPERLVVMASGTYDSADIGTPLAGSTSTVTPDSAYDLTGSGSDIWNNSDGFRYLFKDFTGDFDMKVRVSAASLAGAKVGLMARESLDANSRNVFAGIGVGDAYRLSKRTSVGGSTTNTFKGASPTLPDVWLRLKRVGNDFTGYYSVNGVGWTLMGTVTMVMPPTIKFGMAVSSKSTTVTATAQFRNFGAFGAVAPVAPTNLIATAASSTDMNVGWTAADGATSYRIERKGPGAADPFIEIGTSTVASFLDRNLTPGTAYSYRVRAENSVGLSDYSNVATQTLPTSGAYVGADIGGAATVGTTTEITPGSAYDVTAAGSDIWNNSDQFHFANQRITGNFDIRVRMESPGVIGTKSGLMIRETLDANSRNVFVGMIEGDGYRFSKRTTASGSTSNTFSGGPLIPTGSWLRLKRVGTTITGYYSADGVNWTPMGAINMTLPDTVYFGMAVASKSSTVTSTVKFRDLSIVP